LLNENASVGGKLEFDEVPTRKSSLTARRLLQQIWLLTKFLPENRLQNMEDITATKVPPVFYFFFLYI